MSLISPPPITRDAVDKTGAFLSGWINFFSSLFKALDCLGNSGTNVVVVGTNGGTFTYPVNMETLVLTPAGAIASFNVVLPAVAVDGQPIYINSTQAISALNVSANSPTTVSPSVVTLAANTGCAFRYIKSQNKWFRFL